MCRSFSWGLNFFFHMDFHSQQLSVQEWLNHVDIGLHQGPCVGTQMLHR